MKKIARYILSYYSKIERSISNSQLQKILYFCWIDYYRAEKKYLFNEPFIAWTLGPIIKGVYLEYCHNGGFKIFEPEAHCPDRLNKAVIDTTLERYVGWSLYDLLEELRRTNSAWSEVFYGQGSGAVIPFELIIQSHIIFI